MLTIPAIDLRGARIVRLRQGDFARETAYAADPVALAGAFADAGARWLHVVDLDGARDGAFGNLRTIEAIARSRRLHVQAGGGVRTRADVQRLLDAGVNRVVVGSIAVRDADTVAGWIADFGAERVCVALDARHVDGVWNLHSAGWARDEGASLFDLAARYARCGARHVLCTDIGRDGMLAGPNLELYAQLRTAAPSLGVIASGGVRDVADLRALRAGGVAAAVLGRSLLEGHLRIEEALAC